MNPAFFVLLLIAALAAWILCVFVFIPLGGAIKKIYHKVDKTIKEDKEINKEK